MPWARWRTICGACLDYSRTYYSRRWKPRQRLVSTLCERAARPPLEYGVAAKATQIAQSDNPLLDDSDFLQKNQWAIHCRCLEATLTLLDSVSTEVANAN